MRFCRLVWVATALLVLSGLTVLGASCGGNGTTTSTGEETTTTTIEQTETTLEETTTSEADTTSTTLAGDIDQLAAALAAQMPPGFEIADYKIVDDWAGVVVHSADADDARVLLQRSGGAWSIVTIGTDLLRDDLIDLGAPEEIADLIGASVVTTPTGYNPLERIKAALAASDQIADTFTITGNKIVGDRWAGVIVHSSGTDDAHVLLKKNNGKWSIVTLGTDLSRGGLIALGAPQSIADYIGYATDLSDAALLYAKELGGVSLEGQEIYLVVGDSADTEAEAQDLLDAAAPSFGDMQSYFIVQLAENFDGLTPGYKKYIIVEAYRESPSAENQDFDRRGFPSSAIERATVITFDPIPAYEDVVGL